MWDKFGEFDSAEEINRAAAAQFAEGDEDAVRAIAQENGIDPEDAEDYINGDTEKLCTPLMAAMGKLYVAERELKPYEIMEDWLTYIQMRCAEEPRMAAAVRRKGKTLKGCIAQILVWSFKNAKPVDKDVLKGAGLENQRVTLGIPGMARARKIITEYYLGEKA